MGHKIKVGCGIREILRAGYGMKICWQYRHVFIFNIGGMLDSSEILRVGCRI